MYHTGTELRKFRTSGVPNGIRVRVCTSKITDKQESKEFLRMSMYKQKLPLTTGKAITTPIFYFDDGDIYHNLNPLFYTFVLRGNDAIILYG